jgi:anti-anti-sigma factor
MPQFDFDLRTERDAAGVARVLLRGELDLATAPQLEGALRELREAGEPTVVDLRGLTFLDSTGLRALLQATADAQGGGWSLHIVRPDGEPRVALEQSGADRLLPLVHGDDAP